MSDLTSDEVSDLFLSVQRVGAVLEKAYKAQALTVSLQDGLAAGQSVPHVHVHLIPRHSTDFEGDNDQIYPALEKHESKLKEDFKASEAVGTAWRVPKDEDRRPRTAEVMEQEAKWMESLFDESNTKISELPLTNGHADKRYIDIP